MPDDETTAETGAFYVIDEDAWVPLGKIKEAPLTSLHDYAAEVFDPPKLNSIPITVNWIDWQFIRRYLGLPRLSYVWQYRRWNKGHRR